MRRRQARWTILALVVAALSGVVYQVRTTLLAQKENQVDRSGISGMLPEAVQWIQNFHRVQVKDGRKSWEVEADEAQYLEENGQVLVRNPRAILYLKDGEKVSVRGAQGKIEFKGKDLQKVLLRDSVEIRVRGFTVRSDEALYDRDQDQIFANGPVNIVGQELEVAGSDMIVFVKDSRFELQKRVRVTVLPRDGAKRAS